MPSSSLTAEMIKIAFGWTSESETETVKRPNTNVRIILLSAIISVHFSQVTKWVWDWSAHTHCNRPPQCNHFTHILWMWFSRHFLHFFYFVFGKNSHLAPKFSNVYILYSASHHCFVLLFVCGSSFPLPRFRICHSTYNITVDDDFHITRIHLPQIFAK